MTSEKEVSQETVIVEISPQTTELVKKEMPDASDDVIKATAELFEAIKNRAQIEWQTASELTRDAYLKAAQTAQEAIAQKSPEAKEKIDKAGELIRKEVEKNWQVFDAIKTQAQAKIQELNDLNREKYLEAVREAKEKLEQNKLIEPDRIEQAVQDLQKQVEKNWQAFTNEIESLGTRLVETAKKAWNDLIASVSHKKE